MKAFQFVRQASICLYHNSELSDADRNFWSSRFDEVACACCLDTSLRNHYEVRLLDYMKPRTHGPLLKYIADARTKADEVGCKSAEGWTLEAKQGIIDQAAGTYCPTAQTTNCFATRYRSPSCHKTLHDHTQGC